MNDSPSMHRYEETKFTIEHAYSNLSSQTQVLDRDQREMLKIPMTS